MNALVKCDGFPRGELIVIAASKNLSQPFRWRTSDGVWLTLSEMKTSHIFYTILMIWNNTVEPYMRVGRVKLYNFHPFYTPEYMRKAVREMLIALKDRDDIEDWMLDELFQIWEHIKHSGTRAICYVV